MFRKDEYEMKLFKSLKSRENSFYLNKTTKTSKKVIALDKEMTQLTDEDLKLKTNEFKERIENGENLDSLMVEAFAVCREASARVLNMKHYPVQIIGGITLHQGSIAEMMTGEGKTIVGALPAYLNALTGKGVHIVTVNEYLASRDHEIMSPLYRFLGLTTSVITGGMDSEEKQAAYKSDILYITNTEIGFDYLRDNMVMRKEDKVQGELNFCIVDEVDSVLLDDARTPLIISGEGEEPSTKYNLADMFARIVQKDVDFEIDEEIRSVMLTDSGIDKVEKMFRIENYTDSNNGDVRFFVEKALNAHYMMKRDKDYIIQNNEISIIDESTGRISEGRRYSNGLHQALEAKEGVRIQKENKTLATITYQNFFLLYKKLSGMTGTALTNAVEFDDIYKLRVISIPTNRPISRIDNMDKLYLTASAKNNAIVQDISSCYKKGQPVLVGTSSIEKSELLSGLLSQENIPHVVLNAKNHKKEAGIIENAGQKGIVTIATNMAGRGTDIKLGEGVKELGGLKVIGTERSSNRRIDNQLRGRSGRQGDVGESQYYLSFDDDLLRIFSSDSVRKRVELLSTDDNEPIQMKMLIKSIHSAQARLEGSNFEARKSTIEYDSINNQQRTIIYEQRNEILDEEFDLLGELKRLIVSIREEEFEASLHAVDLINPEDEAVEYQNALDTLQKYCPIGEDKEVLTELTKGQIDVVKNTISEDTERLVRRIETLDMVDQFRVAFVQIVDQVWKEHLDVLEDIKEQVKFAGYKQANPVEEYDEEAFKAFNKAMNNIKTSMFNQVMSVNGSEVEVAV